MNVIITNKYRDALASLDIEVIQKLEGEFTVDEIIESFKNFFYQKMILDITALKNYKDIKTLQKMSLTLDMGKLILLLDGSAETSDPEYISDLISMGIYNFTTNVEAVKYLYEHPNNYRDVAQYHQLDTVHPDYNQQPISSGLPKQEAFKRSIVVFNDITEEAGATTLTYIARKQLARNYNVIAIEVGKKDFMYFDDDKLVSVSEVDLGNTIAKYSDMDIILIDANNSRTALDFAQEAIYLLEPSKIKINKLLAKNSRALINAQNKKIVLNKCTLTSQDVSDFEYETKLKVFYKIPPLNDQSDQNVALDEFLNKLGFIKQVNSSNSGGKFSGLRGLFK